MNKSKKLYQFLNEIVYLFALVNETRYSLQKNINSRICKKIIYLRDKFKFHKMKYRESMN